MVLTLDKVMTEAGTAALRADRLDRHFARAAEAIRDACPTRAGALDASVRKEMARQAHAQAAMWGIVSSADHMRWLVAETILGSRFTDDPLRRPQRQAAGWEDETGAATGLRLLHPLLIATDELMENLAQDLADGQRVISVMQRTIARADAGSDDARIIGDVRALYPVTTAQVRPDDMHAAFLRTSERARVAGLGRGEAAILLALSVPLGCGFEGTPAHRWAGAALQTARDDVERARLALGRGAQALWTRWREGAYRP